MAARVVGDGNQDPQGVAVARGRSNSAPPPPPSQPVVVTAPRRLNYPVQQDEWRTYIFLWGLATTLVGFILITSLIFIIIGFVYRPSNPEFQVKAASISHLDLNGSQTTVVLSFFLSLKNPNKKFEVYYDRLAAAVVYRKAVQLGQAEIPSFHQGKISTTSVQVDIAAKPSELAKEVSNALVDDLRAGNISLRVSLTASLKFRRGVWRSNRRVLEMAFDGLSFINDFKRN
ncbi:NDR1/HIN1-like protein 26 [Malania oleifera]|uniref:NDR1/HIN1-like protein 26 n=1 Tax=Malania oleifera TaxID=397392 RepID=UPI0025ADEBFC|nr:NDR1/HIN1-like protein 26 [Malania oleifera]